MAHRFTWDKLTRNFQEYPIQFREEINKQDLIYLYITCDYTQQQVADIFHCNYGKIIRACKKYKLKKSKEHIRQQQSKTFKQNWQNKTEQEKQEIRNHHKQYWNNLTEQEMNQWKQQVSKNSKKMWQNRDKQAIAATKQKMSISQKIYCENQTQQQKQQRIKAFKKSWYEASEEYKQQRTQNNSNSKKIWWQQLSDEKKQDMLQKQKHTKENKTPQQKQLIQEKIYATKKKNNSLNISNCEKLCEQQLKQYYDNVLSQYKCSEFPFAIDFYIKDINLFIDLNFHWTHGKQPFNENNKEHQKILQKWKEKAKTSKFYRNAIYVWTDLDVRKLNISKQNKINRLVFYKQKEFENWLNKEINHGS